MQKKYLILVLLIAACVTMIAACSGQKWTKSDGSASTKVVERPGDLPALVVDQRISDSAPAQKTAMTSQKGKISKADKFEQENLVLASSIEFEFAKHFVREQYHDGLKKVADSMKENPRTKAILKGHTDNIGTKAYNMRLSKSSRQQCKAVPGKRVWHKKGPHCRFRLWIQ